jgi:hypothetical protein
MLAKAKTEMNVRTQKFEHSQAQKEAIPVPGFEKMPIEEGRSK